MTFLVTVPAPDAIAGPRMALPSAQVRPYVPGESVSEPPLIVTWSPLTAVTSRG